MRPCAVLAFVVLAWVYPLTAWAQDATPSAPGDVRELPTSHDLPAIITLTDLPQLNSRPVSPDGQVVRPQYSAPAVPEGRDAWVIEIVTSGGFTGAIRRTIIDSSGRVLTAEQERDTLFVKCPSSCDVKAPSDALSLVATSVKAAVNVSWPTAAPSNDASISRVSVCSDCLTTQFSLWQRGTDGNVRFFRTQWNSLTASAVDPAVRELYAQAIKAIQ